MTTTPTSLLVADRKEFFVNRVVTKVGTEFEAYAQPTAEDEQCHHLATVVVDYPRLRYGSAVGAKIGWSSTSDKRPVVAEALQVCLTHALDEAKRLDAEAQA